MVDTYTPKDWALSDDITDVDLDHMESGIEAVTDGVNVIDAALKTSIGVTLSSSKTASVNGTITTYAQPAAPLTLFDITPDVNCRLLLSGFVTLQHSSTTDTPDLAWAIISSAGATLRVGPVGNRSRVSPNAPVTLPIGGYIDLTADTQLIGRLGVSSSESGTVTILGSSRTHVGGILVPR